MTDRWIATTSRMLPQFGCDGPSETMTWTDREEAAKAARLMAASDPQGPSLPLVIPEPVPGAGPERLKPEVALEGEIAFDYVNWRGERASRRAIGPYGIRYGTSEFHAEPQYLLSAIDLDRGQPREYALSDMILKN